MSYKRNVSSQPYIVVTGPTSEQIFILNQSNLQTLLSTIIEEGMMNSSEQSCYDPSNGTYTVPVKGLYSFSFMLNCTNNSATGDDSINLGFTITKSGVVTNRNITVNPEQLSTNTGNGTEYQFGFSTITSLNQGDTVALYVNGSTESQTYPINQSNYYINLIAAFS